MQFNLFIVILLPIIAGIIAYIIRDEKSRNALVIICSALIMSASALILRNGNFVLNMEELGTLPWDMIIEVLDLMLGLYILYISVSIKSKTLIILTVFQVIPMFIFENFMGVNLEVNDIIYADHLSIIMNIIISVIGTLIWIFAIGYMKEDEEHKKIYPSRQNRFFAILLIFIGAMNGLVFSNSLVWVYFFWEVTTLSSYLLIGHDGTKEAKESATRALTLNSIGGVAFVAAIIMIYYQLGTIDIQQIVSSKPVGLALVPVALLCLAAFTKSAQIPFHRWLLGAMVAPTPVSALLHSSTMVKAGVYMVIRLAPSFYGSWMAFAITIFGGFTFVAASLMAIGQSNGKRILAYSTIANLGLIISAACIDNATAVAAAIMLLIFHAVSKALLFLCVGTIEHGIGSRDIEDMRGLINRMPFTAVITVIGLVTMLLPPFGVLLSKWLVIETAAKNPILVFMIAIGSALTVVYYTRWIGLLLSRSPGKENIKHEKLSGFIRIPLVLLSVIAITISVLVTFILNKLIVPAVTQYFNWLGLIGMNGGVTGTYGAFSLWPVLLAMVIAIAGGYVSLKSLSGYAQPYMPGETSKDYKVIKINGKEEVMPENRIRNYYFSDILSENKLTPWFDVIAVVLIVCVFGVILL